MASTWKEKGFTSEVASLTEAQKQQIRSEYVPHKMTVPKLAQKHGLSQRTIERVIYEGKERREGQHV